jgi:hypothetical protein
VAWSGKASGSRSGVTGTSVTVPQIYINGQYRFTVTAANAAGAGNAASTSAQLTGPSQRYAVRNNGNSNAYLHATADSNSANIDTMTDNNGAKVTVLCQVKGVYYKHPTAGADFAGDMYVKMTYNKTGYIIGYLITTEGSWKSYAGLPLWRCQ